MTKLRILAGVFTCCPPGAPGFRGGEDVLGWGLVKQISRFHEVWAITRAEDRAGIEFVLSQEPDSNLHFQYVGLPKFLLPLLRFQGTHQFYYYLWQVKAYLTARALQKKVKFDLFHHITYANDWMVSFIGALLPIPYIRGPGGGAHRTPKGLTNEYPLWGRMWEKVRSLGQWLFRHDPLYLRGQSRALAILVCNQESLSKFPGKWAPKIHQFPVNGVSSEDLESATPDKVAESHFQVLSAGSLIRVKGFGLAIKAFKEFVEKYPQSEFSIVGSGPEETKLQALIQGSHLESTVRLVPAMPRERLLSKMASCDVFLFPSLRDGGGAVVIEAMSVGKTVICLDAGGPGTHINEACGIKSSPHSSEDAVHQLAGALERLHQDETLRLELGRAAKDRAHHMYHWDRLGERLMVIYQRALSLSNTN